MRWETRIRVAGQRTDPEFRIHQLARRSSRQQKPRNRPAKVSTRCRHDAGDAACGRATERCVAATEILTELVVDMIHFFATLGEEYDVGNFFADDDAWTFQRIRIFDASFT